MRLILLVCVASIAGLSLLAAAPTASAVGWCTTVGPKGHVCQEHLVCVGWSWDSQGERCQYGVQEPCWYWNCYPQP